MGFDDGADNGKAKACASVLGGEEGFEELVYGVRVKAGSRVRDLDHCPIVALEGADD